MEQFDRMLKGMAEKEECIVPEGFDGRLKETLDALPPRGKKRGLGAVRGALIAAAVCALLMGTAFAASPGLRELLADALGGFAPYAHEQEGEAYVINGMEFKVVSALADDFTVRAYVEVRDLEGDRLNGEMAVWGLVDVPRKDTGEGVTGFTMGAHCAGYDEGTKTALLAVTSWGQVMADDLAGSQVRIFDLSNGPGAQQFWINEEDMAIPVEIEPIPSWSFFKGKKLRGGVQVEEIRASALGLSIVFKGDADWMAFAGAEVSAKLEDGAFVDTVRGGQGSFGEYGTESERKVLIWNFEEPVEFGQLKYVFVNGEKILVVKR